MFFIIFFNFFIISYDLSFLCFSTSVTSNYITCVYSVFALGCTLELADEYMASVNQSTPVVEAVYGYGCNFGHPLDILKTTTPVPETSPLGHDLGNGVYTSGRHPGSGSSRSAASSVHCTRSNFGSARPADIQTAVYGFAPFSWKLLTMDLTNPLFSAEGTLAVSCCFLSMALQTFLARASGLQNIGDHISIVKRFGDCR